MLFGCVCVEKDGRLIYFVNVYASCDNSARKVMWKKLIAFKNNNFPGSWRVGEISTLSLQGGKGGHFKKELSQFKGFIKEMDLA